MKFHGMNKSILLCITFFVSTVFCTKPVEKPYLLVRHCFAHTEHVTWDIASKSGIKVVDHKTPGKSFTFHSKRVRIVSNKQGITFNGKQFFGDSIVIKPLQQGCIAAGKKVAGNLAIVKKKEAVFLVVTPCSAHLSSTRKQDRAYKQVRVLLGVAKGVQHHSWHVTAADGVVVYDLATKKRNLYPSLTIERKNSQLYFNGALIKQKQCMIVPKKEYLLFDNKQYQGAFVVYHDRQKSFLVNKLAIEDYVFSVLKTESWPGWPLEVNKALAITSRTYVHAMILQAERSRQHYHVKNTNLHQTYTGHHTTQVLKLAVEQTKGVILGHEGKPILAMFDSCCGGVIPAHLDGVNFTQAPYLARQYPCYFCKNYKIYSWHAQYEWHELEKHMQHYIPRGHQLRHIKILKKDKAGVVQEVQIKTNRTVQIISGKEWYSLFKEVKSFCFDIEIKNDLLSLSGRGFGHHLGLCQWGARQMVNEGWDYKQILKFYYPNVSFMKVC